MRTIYAALLALLLLLTNVASAGEAGYSLLHHRARDNFTGSARGLEGRINFGGNSERYSGDRWSLALGYVPAREPDVDNWVRVPDGDGGRQFAWFDEAPAYSYLSFKHRWYTRPGRFQWAPELRFFVSTGFSYRRVETCVHESVAKANEYCFRGSLEVSTPACFSQGIGFKWRERIELAVDHCSTGGFSATNAGEDVFRFTIYPLIGRKR